jgi:hypothetical protein
VPTRFLLLLSLLACTWFCTPALSQQNSVTVRFDPSTPLTGPFPTDYLTSPDTRQQTGLSVNLPMPDCTAQPSECAAVTALNKLDGFHLQPRINVTFSGAIDPATLQSGIVFVWLDNLTSEEKGMGPVGKITTINEIIYDPATNTAYAKPNDFFDQHRHYGLIVTNAVHDASGNPVTADPAFTACIQSPQNAYCSGLRSTLANLNSTLPGNVVAASTFTTTSATSWIERARDLLPQVALGFSSVGTPIPAAGLTQIKVLDQSGGNRIITVPTASGTAGSLDGVDRLVFGSYHSPNFLNSQQYIPEVSTGAALSQPASNTILFHAYIPSLPMPAAGYPVIIFGHAWAENLSRRG